VNLFVPKHLAEALDPEAKSWLQLRVPEIADLVDEMVIEEQSRQDEAFAASRLEVDVEALDPLEFENYCTTLLKKAGWEARTTQASGDQGVDIVATKNGYTVVFQVKLWRRPVGNKAVQEAHAGRQHVRALGAAVVTNNRFTSAAFQLAESSGVLLLHYRDLSTLEPHDFPRH